MVRSTYPTALDISRVVHLLIPVPTYTSSFLTFTITRRCNSTTHKSMSCSVLVKIFCTGNGTRTHTLFSEHQILSLRRLPIPPSQHLLYQIIKEQFIHNLCFLSDSNWDSHCLRGRGFKTVKLRKLEAPKDLLHCTVHYNTEAVRHYSSFETVSKSMWILWESNPAHRIKSPR